MDLNFHVIKLEEVEVAFLKINFQFSLCSDNGIYFIGHVLKGRLKSTSLSKNLTQFCLV